MKRTILTMVLGIAILTAHAQSVQYLGGCGDENAMDITCDEDNLFICAISHSYTWGCGDIYVAKTNRDGMAQWAKIYGNPYCSNTLKIFALNKNNILLTDLTGNLMNLDSAGNVKWAKHLGNSAIITAITALHQNYILAGYIQGSHEDHDLLLTKIDTSGYILQSSYYPFTPDETGVGEIFFPKAFSCESDSTFLLIGDKSGQVQYSFVARFNDSFGLKNLLTFSGGLIPRSVAIAKTSSNEYLISGNSSLFNESYVGKLGANLDFLWYKNYSDQFHQNPVVVTTPLNLLISTSENFSSNSGISITTLDDAGNPISTALCGDATYNYTFKGTILVSGKDQYLLNTSNANIAGNTLAGNLQKDIMIFPIDSFGHAPAEIPVITQSITATNVSPVVGNYSLTKRDTLLTAYNITLSGTLVHPVFDSLDCIGVGIQTLALPEKKTCLHPNPNNGGFYLSLPNANEEEVNIEIFNILGESVYQHHLNNTSLETPAFLETQLKNGLYFVKITNGKQTFTESVYIMR